MTEIMHGGRLDEAVARFGGERERWLDLSTGINPHAYPIPEIADAAWTALPDRDAEDQARLAVHEAYGAHESAGISLAPGSQMHIQMLPYLFRPQPVAIVGFTYQEHGVCWQRANHKVYVTDGLSSAEATARIVIVVNPNNPDGRLWTDADAPAAEARAHVEVVRLRAEHQASTVSGVVLRLLLGRHGVGRSSGR